MPKVVRLGSANGGSRGQYEVDFEAQPSTLEAVDHATRLWQNAFYRFGSEKSNLVLGMECVSASGKHLWLALNDDDIVVKELLPYESNDAFDRQSDISTDSVATDIQVDQHTDYVGDLRDIVWNPAIPLANRAAAAMKVALVDPDSVRSWTIEQLSAKVLDTEAATNLIYLADELRFPDEKERNQLWQSLMNHAVFLRSRNDPFLEAAIGTAIRRIASVLPESEADELVKFLANDSGLDTRLMALQAVCIVFSMEPYSGSELIDLKVRINELRKKLVDSDVLAVGQMAAIASAAITACTCVAYASVDDILANLTTVQPWFRDVVKRALLELAGNWHDSSCKSASELMEKVVRFGTQAAT
jgi:hypothetical protein